MIFSLFVLGIAIIILFLVWYSTIRVEILFKRDQQNNDGEIKIVVFGGLLRFKFNLSQLEWKGFDEGIQVKGKLKNQMAKIQTGQKKEKVQVNKRKVRAFRHKYLKMLRQIDEFQQIMHWFFGKITCEKLIWKTRLGTGDAAEAGILTGIAWGIKWALVGMLGSRIRWKFTPQLSIDPDFNHEILEIYFHSIIRFRIGHAILTVKRLSDHMRQ
ncbi:DUF2953 domain-containing protein [Thermoactinomyces sp. AMNI-1]|uniref:DUF2953 domain-containing protein n=1 Tax=Thermoactinomyces mirandus TaxID=2756294 RepID=A0A7W2ATS5_9BACL|nr:DUF2953 domain-containing protein [Thermoactinomyces mirandus]